MTTACTSHEMDWLVCQEENSDALLISSGKPTINSVGWGGEGGWDGNRGKDALKGGANQSITISDQLQPKDREETKIE